MGSESIGPRIGIAAKTASSSSVSRFHTTAGRYPNALMPLLTVKNLGLPPPAKALYRLSRFTPAFPATSVITAYRASKLTQSIFHGFNIA